MCDEKVIGSVKKNMLNADADEQDFFRRMREKIDHRPEHAYSQQMSYPFCVEDLTHALHENFPTFMGSQQFFFTRQFNHGDHGFNQWEWRVVEHTGTHVDAPLHFTADGKSVDEIPVEDLVLPLVVIDIREKAHKDANASVTPDDLRTWMDRNGEVPDGAAVAMLSGWDKYVSDRKFKNMSADGASMHFPGFHVETVHAILESTMAKALVVDTLSLDPGAEKDFPVHRLWLGSGRYGIEAVSNLDRLPAKGAMLSVGAPKVRGGSGGPSRVVAFY
ncbi:cyclase [Burkholderia ubonensis]|uniref:Cyclase n=1 Tax=Burkholderia ubonensis TaxID=101571 RepID=A0AAW3N3Z0_9BURK|nr:cyclase family protein [Burkholderia ubonensis]KVC74315.1 cyclase [Burkholderia ubonensis]KVD18115.1 cyclase [Burkholderia ubonensis]KVG74750.1 cyclase [Burkholderia ubonensis]KVH17236.1 cyclase [Burkholderia ubonensis]KVH48491.1 cyclase [Burkholderia ubonensis]